MVRRVTVCCWWALLVAVVGGTLSRILMMDRVSPESYSWGLLLLAITVIVAGLLVIWGTADWWLKR